MDRRERRIKAVLLGAGLLGVLAGEAYFTLRPQYVWDGVVFCLLGMACWALALRRRPRRGQASWLARGQALLTAHPARAALLLVSVMLCLGAGLTAVRPQAGPDFAGPLWTWLVGLLLFLASLMPLPPADARERLRAWARAREWELAGLAALLVAALLVRAVALETIPANFGGDEGTQALAALRLVTPPLGNPFSTGWYSVPTMSFLVYGLAMELFGFTVAGARMLSALIGTATVLATFLLARRLLGRWEGWVAALLVAFGHYGLHFSRLASNQVADALFGALVLYLLLQGWQEQGARRPMWFGLSGVALGLAWYGYFGARVTTVVVGLYLLWRALAEPRFLRRHRQDLTLLLTGALVATAPLLLHYLAHPEQFFSRYDQVSIFASGWLHNEMLITGRSRVSLLLQQFWKSISAFHVTPDPTFWYHPGVPLLDPISGILLLFGLVVALVQARRPARGLLLLWFFALVILGWTLTENPPSSQRGVGVVPVVAILAAMGLVEMVGMVQQLLGRTIRQRWVGRAFLALLLAVIAIANLVFYFGIYSPRRVYGNPTAEISDVLCDALEGEPAVEPVYFDGAPAMYWDFGATAFRLRAVEGRDWAPEEGFEGIDLSRGALFVVLAERLDDLTQIQAAFPSGSATPFYSQVDGRLLFVLYRVPARRTN